tara:strand:- start:27374 stop:27646 length:273 start_codon:yes stop_codon:yes gene_type:complete
MWLRLDKNCPESGTYQDDDLELLIDVITNHDLNNSDAAKEVRRKYHLRLINLCDGYCYEINGHTIVKIIKYSSIVGCEPIIFDIPEEASW